MPIGMDTRYIKAKSAEDALIFFKTNFPRFKDCPIVKMDDTTCRTLDELVEWYPHFNPNINERTH